MNRKRLSNTVCYVMLMLLSIALITTGFTGCGSGSWGLRNMAAVSRYFDRDVNTVWNGVIQAVEGIPVEIKDKEHGFLKTQWVKGWSTKKTTGLLLEGHWQERYRLLIKVTEEQDKTYVSVNTQVQEKAPGGSRAYRWDRIPSDGTIEQTFLKNLEDILNQ
ncbi:MAG: outer membrane protein assembly factor BamC [Candidatus Brocadia sp.]|nr:outer membrane protein assembly factor BamC [Candidatus Brocadia sp.]